MSFNIVLFNPQIPQNTGNIARLSAGAGCVLHLIEPLGFEITDKRVKRAGLDYWGEVKLIRHPSWACFLSREQVNNDNIWLVTTKTQTSYFQASFNKGDYFVFGKETTGLPQEIHDQFPTRRITIPMFNPNIRSLNISNSVSIITYEAVRQIHGL